MIDERRFYGIYLGVCADVDDPDKDNRIRLQVPQVLGQEITEWARGCLPITANSNHPDHLEHTAAQVAALLVAHGDHVIAGTTGSGGTPSHSHSFSYTAVHQEHTGNLSSIKHAHVTTTSTDNKWNDDQETNQTPEHTPHRLVPAVGQKVWVMFEGGDPNYPVWMGVEL